MIIGNAIVIGGGGGYTIVVTVDSGAVVTASKDGKTVVAVSVDGIATLKVPEVGAWSVWATMGESTTEPVIVEVYDTFTTELSFGLPLSGLAEGALIKLNEGGTGVNFYLAKHDYESGLNGARCELLVRKDCYNKRVWHSSAVNAYATSSIDSFLNGEYYNLFPSAVRDIICTTSFPYTPGNGNNTISTLSRKIFLLSEGELTANYNYSNHEGSILPIANTLMSAYIDGTIVEQWTRSPVTPNTGAAIYIKTNGYVHNANVNAYEFGCRPCLTVKHNSTVNPEPNADGSYTLIA